MKKEKIYISGKMSGMEEEVYKRLFKNAEEKLISEGYEVFNPCEIEYIPEDYAQQLLLVLGELAKCDCIYMLENWIHSNGARCEYWFAKGSGKKIIFEWPFEE